MIKSETLIVFSLKAMKNETTIVTEKVAQKQIFESIEVERRHRKERLTASLRLFAQYGFDEGIAGHITVRDPEHEHYFWVNPFGIYFGLLKTSDLICVDTEGNIIEGKDKKLNHAAFVIHAAIHKARPDIHAAVHAHSIYGRIFSATGRMIRPLTIEATPFYKDHILFDSIGGIVSEVEEGNEIARALGNKKAAILRNHGLLTVGETVDSAVWWFIALERSCQTEIMAQIMGNPIELNQHEAEKGYRQLGNELAGHFQYQPLFQKITSQQPDLFD